MPRYKADAVQPTTPPPDDAPIGVKEADASIFENLVPWSPVARLIDTTGPMFDHQRRFRLGAGRKPQEVSAMRYEYWVTSGGSIVQMPMKTNRLDPKSRENTAYGEDDSAYEIKQKRRKLKEGCLPIDWGQDIAGHLAMYRYPGTENIRDQASYRAWLLGEINARRRQAAHNHEQWRRKSQLEEAAKHSDARLLSVIEKLIGGKIHTPPVDA